MITFLFLVNLLHFFFFTAFYSNVLSLIHLPTSRSKNSPLCSNRLLFLETFLLKLLNFKWHRSFLGLSYSCHPRCFLQRPSSTLFASLLCRRLCCENLLVPPIPFSSCVLFLFYFSNYKRKLI